VPESKRAQRARFSAICVARRRVWGRWPAHKRTSVRSGPRSYGSRAAMRQAPVAVPRTAAPAAKPRFARRCHAPSGLSTTALCQEDFALAMCLGAAKLAARRLWGSCRLWGELLCSPWNRQAGFGAAVRSRGERSSFWQVGCSAVVPAINRYRQVLPHPPRQGTRSAIQARRRWPRRSYLRSRSSV